MDFSGVPRESQLRINFLRPLHPFFKTYFKQFSTPLSFYLQVMSALEQSDHL